MGTTVDEARRLRELCERYELENREILAKYTDGQLAAIYNGIGPEAFPGWLRAALDAIHPSLAPVAFIHDVEWHESDGSEESFEASNDRFRTNGIAVACAAFGWWRPRRYKVMWDAVKFARVCQRFGWSAWRAPYEARQKGISPEAEGRAAEAGASGVCCVKRLLALCGTAAALAALCGCASQEIIQREFYEPTDQTIHEREDKLKVGALKSETIKTGQPDWSAKTISVISVGK